MQGSVSLPHYRTLEIRPRRISYKLNYDYDSKAMNFSLSLYHLNILGFGETRSKNQGETTTIKKGIGSTTVGRMTSMTMG